MRVDYNNATGGITTTFNPTTNIGSITAGISRVSYKNIERLNISGTAYDDNIVGSNGNDTLSGGVSGKDTIDGGKGDDLLSVDYTNATGGITRTLLVHCSLMKMALVGGSVRYNLHNYLLGCH
ncbi:MAG: hypothetical protein V7K92_14650 [Nostoc sp.]